MSRLPENSGRLTLIEAVLLALYKSGGEQKLVHEEDVALGADKLAPGQFRWRIHTDRVNLYTARLALKDAKHQQLIDGTNKHGWQLTASGLQWVRDNIEEVHRRPSSFFDQKAAQRRKLEASRLHDLSALGKYRRGELVSKREAAAVFRVDDYSSPQRRKEAVDRSLMLFCGDDEFESFVQQMAQVVLGEQS